MKVWVERKHNLPPEERIFFIAFLRQNVEVKWMYIWSYSSKQFNNEWKLYLSNAPIHVEKQTFHQVIMHHILRCTSNSPTEHVIHQLYTNDLTCQNVVYLWCAIAIYTILTRNHCTLNNPTEHVTHHLHKQFNVSKGRLPILCDSNLHDTDTKSMYDSQTA